LAVERNASASVESASFTSYLGAHHRITRAGKPHPSPGVIARHFRQLEFQLQIFLSRVVRNFKNCTVQKRLYYCWNRQRLDVPILADLNLTHCLQICDFVHSFYLFLTDFRILSSFVAEISAWEIFFCFIQTSCLFISPKVSVFVPPIILPSFD
jgi:hypothetical protein